jgi:Domain of unknown function (DUF3806)
VPTNPTFTAPEDSDYKWLASCWVSVGNLIKEEWGYEINQSMEDLEYLQRVIDEELIDFGDEHSCDCVGVAFGRVVATNVPDLDWWVVHDSYGRGLAIRYRETTLQYNVIEMIGKRLSQGIKANLNSLFAFIARHKEEMKDRVD